MNLFTDFDTRIKNALETIDIVKEKRPELDFGRISVEPPRDPSHGEVATNAAMVLSKPLGQNPRAIADIIAAKLREDGDIAEVSVAGPGFINIRLSVAYWQRLGFKRLAGDNKPYPWAIVSDGRVRLGLHQAARFTQPALSYFAPDMPERLEQFRQQGLQLISTHKNAQGLDIGALIHSPDGQPILLFQGNESG